MPGRTDNPNRHRTQRQTRLAGLLAQRDQIAQTWAERFSHGLPGVGMMPLTEIPRGCSSKLPTW